MDEHVDLNMNTVVFQVFTHGMAFWDSERVPWSHLITDEPGKDPGWDPLAYAVEVAHERGLELHAWYNVFQMGNPNTEINADHVRNTNPDWVKPYHDGLDVRDYWINPAHPEAREWLVGNVLEIVENYDVDAIHFDYIRYPAYGFDDDHISKREWPNDAFFIDDWKRENVNIFAREVYAAVKEAKPWVKVGSAPIGTYKNDGTPGFWAWDHLYQASRVWLEEGVHDYLAPQLYFDIGTGFSSHDFRSWLIDWINNSHGRHIYAGHGTWRESFGDFSTGEIGRQIGEMRERGADGSLHFRQSFVSRTLLRGQYDTPSLPARMPWRPEAAAPTAPAQALIEWSPESQTITISWDRSEASDVDPLRRYALFRSEGAPPDVTTAEDLVAIVGAQDTTYTETFTEPPRPHVYYSVVAQSQYGMVSDPSPTVTTETTPLTADLPQQASSVRIHDVYPNPAVNSVRVRFEVPSHGNVTFTLYDLLGRSVAVPFDADQSAGSHELELHVGDLAPAVYLLEMVSAAGTDVRRMVVGR